MVTRGSQQRLESGRCLFKKGSPPQGPLSSPAWKGPSPTNSPHPGGLRCVCRKEAQTRSAASPCQMVPLQQLRLLCEARPAACVRAPHPHPVFARPACLPACLVEPLGKLPSAPGSCSQVFLGPHTGRLIQLGTFWDFSAPTAPSPCDLSRRSWLSFC